MYVFVNFRFYVYYIIKQLPFECKVFRLHSVVSLSVNSTVALGKKAFYRDPGLIQSVVSGTELIVHIHTAPQTQNTAELACLD